MAAFTTVRSSSLPTTSRSSRTQLLIKFHNYIHRALREMCGLSDPCVLHPGALRQSALFQKMATVPWGSGALPFVSTALGPITG